MCTHPGGLSFNKMNIVKPVHASENSFLHPRSSNRQYFSPTRHPKCEGGGDVVGVVTPLVGGVAQAFRDDRFVELSVLLEVHEKEEEEEDGEGQIEVESERGELKERRTCTWMT